MNRKRFSPATAVMVVMLLGALVLVAKQVTPAPPGPPETAKAAPAAPPEHNHEEDGHKHMPPPPPDSPTVKPKNVIPATDTTGHKPILNKSAVDVDSQYWRESKDGEAGIKEMQQRVQEGEAYAKRQQEEDAKAEKKKVTAPPAPKAK